MGTIKRGRLVNKTIKEDSNGVITYGEVKDDSTSIKYLVDKGISSGVEVQDLVSFSLSDTASKTYAKDVTKVGAQSPDSISLNSRRG